MVPKEGHFGFGVPQQSLGNMCAGIKRKYTVKIKTGSWYMVNSLNTYKPIASYSITCIFLQSPLLFPVALPLICHGTTDMKRSMQLRLVPSFCSTLYTQIIII